MQGDSSDDNLRQKLDWLAPTGQWVDAGRVRIGDAWYAISDVTDALSGAITESRKARVETILDGRTPDVATVVEGIANLGNVGAVMRTAEAFGFQRFHAITRGVRYKDSARTTQGAHKWLDVHRWDEPEACIAALHAGGYRVFVTSVDPGSASLEEVDFSGRCALVFGNELEGVSTTMGGLADRRICIPTPGFVESFNISVAAAICLYHVYRYRRDRGIAGGLSDAERAILRARFYMKSVRGAEEIVKRFCRPERR